MKKLVMLKLNAEKKHSVRYDYDNTGGTVGGAKPLVTSIYITKSHLPVPFPETITVTVES